MKLANFLPAITCLVSGVVQAGSPTPEILVTALRGMQWQVRYDFAQPVDRLEFKTSPDDSREGVHSHGDRVRMRLSRFDHLRAGL
jgi:hypothetical protein